MSPAGGPSNIPSAGGFLSGLAQGAWEGAKSMAGGLYDLAAMSAGGYKQLAQLGKELYQNPQAREEAMQAIKDAAKALKGGAQEAREFAEYLSQQDPSELISTAKDGALAAANAAKAKGKELLAEGRQAYADALAKGEGSQFVGRAIGRTAFEVGALFVGAGEAAKAGKLAEVAELSKMGKVDTIVLPCGKVVARAEVEAAEVAAKRGAAEAVESVKRRDFSGGHPTILNDAYNPDVVNARSAEFFEHYGDDALRGTMDNATARQWYLEQEAKIADQLDRARSLEDQAKQAFELRNTARTRARELMSDRVTADRLAREELNRIWDDLVAQRKAAGLQGDAIYQSIIDSSKKSRAAVNKALGL